jgi:hypothetical protein
LNAREKWLALEKPVAKAISAMESGTGAARARRHQSQVGRSDNSDEHFDAF